MAANVSLAQALAWRMRRQLLDPVGDLPLEDVVTRLCGLQAQVASFAELAIRLRQRQSRSGGVAQALEEGRLLKTWAMRGALHLFTPQDASVVLSITASGRMWERWRRYLGTSPRQMQAFRNAVRDALNGEPVTRAELSDALGRRRGMARLADELRSSWGGLLKPLAWEGELCFGPPRGSQVTFTRPDRVAPGWPRLTDADDAGPRVIAKYLSAYGPADLGRLGAWLGEAADKRRLAGWFREMDDRLAEVQVAGQPAYVLADDVDELVSTRPTSAVRLLPGFDQYVLGPGTGDGWVTPAGRRSAVSRPAGWISPVVVRGGVVSGTWQLERDEVRVTWFGENGKPPRTALAAEAERLGAILGRDLRWSVV